MFMHSLLATLHASQKTDPNNQMSKMAENGQKTKKSGIKTRHLTKIGRTDLSKPWTSFKHNDSLQIICKN